MRKQFHKYFNLSEFSSPGYPKRSDRVPVPPKYVLDVRIVMTALETIRAALGHKPIRIISGYRTQAYNRQNKGRATKSLHLVGKAADMQVKGVRPARVYWVIKDLMDKSAIPLGGLAAYPTFVHYDIRGRRARWRKAPPRPKSGLGSKGS